MLPHPGRARLSPLARTTLLLTVASGALALTPVPSATSLPLPAVTHTAAVHPAGAASTARVRAHKGSTGNLVMAIQIKVGQHRDGEYGARTAAAVAAWQRRHGLPATGVVDQTTYLRMFPPAATTYRTGVQTIGYSVLGRPIRLTVVGSPTAVRRVMLVGAFHGNERGGPPIVDRLAHDKAPGGVAYFIVRDPNPDGGVAHTRQSKQAQEAYAHATRMPARTLRRYPGSQATWTHAAFPRATVLTIELPASVSASSVTRHAQAVRFLATHH